LLEHLDGLVGRQSYLQRIITHPLTLWNNLME
jgi:hypothetical protein